MRILLIALLAGCATIRPLPLPQASGAGTSPPLHALEADLRGIIRMHSGDTVEIAVAFMDLETGDSLLIDAHTEMHAASTMKLPVMLELFRRAEAGDLTLDERVRIHNQFRSIADGSTYSLSPGDDSDPEIYSRFGETETLRSLIRRMIVRSSNLATNLVIDRADPARIARTLDEIGASEMKVLRGVEDGPAFRRGMNNTTTAYGLMKTFEAVGSGRVVSQRAAEEMVDILAAQEFRQIIPAGVPEEIRVASKSGWITGIDHDGALVFPPDRAPYALVVLMRGFLDREAAARAGRNISRRVWAEVQRGR